MRKTVGVALLCLLSIWNACDKGCPYKDIMAVHQEMKDWVAFDTGTYWIYVDSLTGKNDTQLVYDLAYKLEDTYGGGKCPIKRQRVLERNFAYDSSFSQFALTGKYDTNEKGDTIGAVWMTSKRERALSSPYLMFPLKEGDTYTYGSKSRYTTERIYGEYEVNGVIYADVVCTHDAYSLVEGNECRYYHAKNIGLIKKVIYKRNSTETLAVWELAAYEVMK
jgi:hypothetical protein